MGECVTGPEREGWGSVSRVLRGRVGECVTDPDGEGWGECVTSPEGKGWGECVTSPEGKGWGRCVTGPDGEGWGECVTSPEGKGWGRCVTGPEGEGWGSVSRVLRGEGECERESRVPNGQRGRWGVASGEVRILVRGGESRGGGRGSGGKFKGEERRQSLSYLDRYFCQSYVIYLLDLSAGTGGQKLFVQMRGEVSESMAYHLTCCSICPLLICPVLFCYKSLSHPIQKEIPIATNRVTALPPT